MRAEDIGYRFARDEFEALRLLLNLPDPIGAPERALDEPALDRALQVLGDGGILTEADDAVLIDPLCAFLMRQTCQATAALRALGTREQILLYRAPDLSLVAGWTLTHVTLTPAQTGAGAAEHLMDALQKLTPPFSMDWLDDAGAVCEAGEAESHEAARALAGRYLAAIYAR